MADLRYGLNDQDFIFDTLEEMMQWAAETDSEMVAGDPYWTAEYVPYPSSDFDVTDTLLEIFDERLEVEDQTPFTDMDYKATQDLTKRIQSWIDDHKVLDGFFKFVNGSVREHKITHEDVIEFNRLGL